LNFDRLQLVRNDVDRIENCESLRQTLVHSSERPEASVLLASIGSCEIRMFRGPEAALDGTPLFWLELIDHSIKTSVDSCSCHRLKDAVAIFDDFISQAARLNEPGGWDDQ
jgi:hypothetical protein